MRLLRIALLTLALATILELGRTMPYLGLPGEPPVQFMDCYAQAKWDGRVYIPTGKMLCLGEP